MEREIKFRAWDGTKYITFDNHQYDLIYNDISGWNVCPNVPNYKGEWTTGESSSTAESFILEQFTGLKDKNGKDIYEGDLVNYGVKSYYNPNPLHKVLFGYGSFYLENIEDPSCNTEFESPESEFEVVGNVHETAI